MGCLWRKPAPTKHSAPLLSEAQREEPHHSLSPPLLAPHPWQQEGPPPGWALLRPSHGLPRAPPPPSADPCALGQPLEQTPVGGSHAQMELKAQLSPTVKETKLRSLLAAALTMLLHRNRLCQLSPCRASEGQGDAPSHSRRGFSNCRRCGLVTRGRG